MFDASNGRDGAEAVNEFEGFGEPRAHVAEDGKFWFGTSIRILARRLGLCHSTCGAALATLEEKGFIESRMYIDERLVTVNGFETARAYHAATGDEVAKSEWLDAGDPDAHALTDVDQPTRLTSWFRSKTRRRAMGHLISIRGTYVPYIMTAALRHPGIARMLAQICWWFSDRGGKSRAGWLHLETSQMFVRLSDRDLARQLGVPNGTVHRWRTQLQERDLIIVEVDKHRGRPTNYIRPNPTKLAELLSSVEGETRDRLNEAPWLEGTDWEPGRLLARQKMLVK